jgi:hypothetical protein
MRGDAETRSASSRMLARGQKRRMGQRDLWDLIVNNDDVCFKHILPRLNGTDIKFLYDVNTETRALIKRAMASGIELQKKFKIAELSSISTLEFAWDNVLGNVIHQPAFCWRVARTNKLELLKWIREEKKCGWSPLTIEAAAERGNLEMVKYCIANECPVDEHACACAAYNGHLECLKYLHEEARAPWDWLTAVWAARNGHLHILEYLIERKYDKFCASACFNTAVNGHLDCLKYLHETAKAPWDSFAVRYAHENNHRECLQYLLDNNCPLPIGWSYEGGILRTSNDDDSS